MWYRRRESAPTDKLSSLVTLEALSRAVPLATIEAVWEAHHAREQRERKLRMGMVVWALIAMNLYPQVSLDGVLRKISQWVRRVGQVSVEQAVAAVGTGYVGPSQRCARGREQETDHDVRACWQMVLGKITIMRASSTYARCGVLNDNIKGSGPHSVLRFPLVCQGQLSSLLRAGQRTTKQPSCDPPRLWSTARSTGHQAARNVGQSHSS